jgi:tetratricopeptide (TPR) repeat protein
MEKNELLDASCQAERKRVMKKVLSMLLLKGMKIISFIGIIIMVPCLFAGCSLPRIIVLDDPLSPEEHINLGVTYEKKGELDNALKEYREASGKLPVAFLYMGNVFLQKNEFGEAEFNYKKAIMQDPRNADAYNNLAWLYYVKKENLDEAESLVLKAMELNPSKKEIYQDTLDRIRDLKTLEKAGGGREDLPAKN